MAQIPRNVQTMQQNCKENGFQIIKFMIKNTFLSRTRHNLFLASQKICWASKNHELLARHGMLVRKTMLVPAVFHFTLFTHLLFRED